MGSQNSSKRSDWNVATRKTVCHQNEASERESEKRDLSSKYWGTLEIRARIATVISKMNFSSMKIGIFEFFGRCRNREISLSLTQQVRSKFWKEDPFEPYLGHSGNCGTLPITHQKKVTCSSNRHSESRSPIAIDNVARSICKCYGTCKLILLSTFVFFRGGFDASSALAGPILVPCVV